MADINLTSKPYFGIDKPVVKLLARSQSKLQNIQFTWTVNNFSFRPQKNGEVLESPTFSAGTNEAIKWNVRLYPKGYTKETKENLSAFLLLSSLPSDKSEVMAKFKISILNREPEKTISAMSTEARPFKLQSTWGFERIMELKILINEANGFLTDDELKLVCEISFVSGSFDTFQHFEDSKCNKIGDDFGMLLDNPKFSDVTLVSSGDKKLPAHKAILAARSDVFAAMFEHDMEESKSGRVIITDVEHEVLQEMLHFIYTGDVPKIKEIPSQLLAAADKYAIKELKRMSEQALLDELSIETAAETLLLADLHNANKLKEKTILFITYHAKDIFKTEGWTKLTVNNPTLFLLTEAFEALAIQK